jgi:hypothetical protein
VRQAAIAGAEQEFLPSLDFQYTRRRRPFETAGLALAPGSSFFILSFLFFDSVWAYV